MYTCRIALLFHIIVDIMSVPSTNEIGMRTIVCRFKSAAGQLRNASLINMLAVSVYIPYPHVNGIDWRQWKTTTIFLIGDILGFGSLGDNLLSTKSLSINTGRLCKFSIDNVFLGMVSELSIGNWIWWDASDLWPSSDVHKFTTQRIEVNDVVLRYPSGRTHSNPKGLRFVILDKNGTYLSSYCTPKPKKD